MDGELVISVRVPAELKRAVAKAMPEGESQTSLVSQLLEAWLAGHVAAKHVPKPSK